MKAVPRCVTVHSGEPHHGCIAKVGNTLFAAIKMLLDYRGRTMSFYGESR
jgi:hypothetical protein